MEKKDVRVQLVISQSEIDALDEWRAANKIWSRSEAIRMLVADGVKRAKGAERADQSGKES
jgi:metal-responsive CopG/Arc/MetJ family transcriptional regulator